MKKFFIETYGCQMNFSDSEIVVSVLKEIDYEITTDIKEADLILLNTCSIREKAEQRIWNRLKHIHALRRNKSGLKVAVIGCMAERLKDRLIEGSFAVDIVAGPDSYRDLPNLIQLSSTGQKAANIQLSIEETYQDIAPTRYDTNGVSAYISIMRGCENYCSYCVVPYTRGRERSREPQTIVDECRRLVTQGYKEVTLLGQNVNSYRWDTVDFPQLMQMVANVSPELRIRFCTSHPKDLSNELLGVIAVNENICKSIHLAVQSGSTKVLKAMNRKYTREWYLDRVEAIRRIVPNCAISTDIIAGFCGETEDDHKDTLSLMELSAFDYAFMFQYSERSGTLSAKTMNDDVNQEDKARRLQEIIDKQQELSLRSNQKDIGTECVVLAESISKKSTEKLSGRNSQNKVVIFPRGEHNVKDYVKVRIINCTAATLIGELV